MFSFNSLRPGFDSVSPWQSRKQEIYKNVNKKYMHFQNNDNKETLLRLQFFEIPKNRQLITAQN